MDRNKKEQPVLEATLEGGEVVADVVLRGDLLAEIPIIGTAVKVVKALDSVRDRIFAAKILRFVEQLEKVPEGERKAFRSAVESDPKESKRVGESLLLTIEHVTDLEKPALQGVLFIAYLDGVIGSVDLRRMTQAVDMAFPDDIETLIRLKDVPKKSEEPWVASLAPSGLSEVVVGETYDDLSKVYHGISKLGRSLRNAYYHGRKKQQG